MKKKTKQGLVRTGANINSVILELRGQKVILDADLASIYGVSTKRLNEQVKRNQDRFPGDFAFQLTPAEKSEVVANCDHLAKLKFSPALPRAFTEHGALMAANVLNSPRAVQMSVFVVRAFLKMRSALMDTRELARKLAALESELKSRLDVHEIAIVEVLQRVMKILDPPPPPPEPPAPEIGFHVKEEPAPCRIRRTVLNPGRTVPTQQECCQLQPEMLDRYCAKFQGFGNAKAKVWFIGIEEAGAWDCKDIQRRLLTWHAAGEPSFADAATFYPRCGNHRWHGLEAEAQPTWRQLIRMLLLARGGDDRENEIWTISARTGARRLEMSAYKNFFHSHRRQRTTGLTRHGRTWTGCGHERPTYQEF